MFQTIVFLHIAIFSYLNIVPKKIFFVRYAECIHCNKQLLFHRDAVERGVFKPFPLPLSLPFPPWHQCQYKNNMPERRRERREGEAGKILFFSLPPYERNEAGHPPPFSLSFSPPQPTAPKQSTHTHSKAAASTAEGSSSVVVVFILLFLGFSFAQLG